LLLLASICEETNKSLGCKKFLTRFFLPAFGHGESLVVHILLGYDLAEPAIHKKNIF
jgi:hypothetical protein